MSSVSGEAYQAAIRAYWEHGHHSDFLSGSGMRLALEAAAPHLTQQDGLTEEELEAIALPVPPAHAPDTRSKARQRGRDKLRIRLAQVKGEL